MARYVLPRASRADAEGHVVRANGLHVFALAGGLGRDVRLARRGIDAFGVEIAQRVRAFVLHDVHGLREVPRANRAAGAQGVLQQLEKILRARHLFRRAVELDPSFA
jgi:hypothetical protein